MAGTAAAQPRAGKSAWGSYGVETTSADRSVKPGDDFWSYVNGTWARTVEIPADQGAASQVQRLNNLAAGQVRVIIEDMRSRGATLSTDQGRVVDYYSALMDDAAITLRERQQPWSVRLGQSAASLR
jgi:predicted metalloendopeptidase